MYSEMTFTTIHLANLQRRNFYSNDPIQFLIDEGLVDSREDLSRRGKVRGGDPLRRIRGLDRIVDSIDKQIADGATSRTIKTHAPKVLVDAYEYYGIDYVLQVATEEFVVTQWAKKKTKVVKRGSYYSPYEVVNGGYECISIIVDLAQ